jgi:hypothetical protein
MPIVAKYIMEARRAAAAERQRLAQQALALTPVEPPEPQPAETPPLLEPQKRRRGHAVRNAAGKWQPTGPDGFANPPEDNKFKKNCAPGPGRPKGSHTHDTLLKRQLEKKRKVRLEGKDRSITTRELLLATTVKDAVEGKDRNARKYLLAEMQRLYPGEVAGMISAQELNASDALSLAEYEAELREEIREELLREMRGAGGETLQ